MYADLLLLRAWVSTQFSARKGQRHHYYHQHRFLFWKKMLWGIGGFSLLIYHRCRQALIPIYFETKLTIAPPVVLYFLKYISYSKDCLRSVNHWNTTAFWNFKKKYYKLSTFPSKKVIFHCSVFSVNNAWTINIVTGLPAWVKTLW